MRQSTFYYLLILLSLCIIIPQNSTAHNQTNMYQHSGVIDDIYPSSSELLEVQELLDKVFEYSGWMLLMRESYSSNLRHSIGVNKLPVQLHVESRKLLLDFERFINSMYLSYWEEPNSDICTNHILSLLVDTELYNHYQYTFAGLDYRLFNDIDNYIEHTRKELEDLKKEWDSCLQNGLP